MGAGGNYLTRCLCFDLRTGSLIIGVSSLIVSCVGLLTMVALGVMALLIRVEAVQQDPNQQVTCGHKCTVVLLVMFFVEYLFHLIAASLMIHGVRKNRPVLMKPYFFWGIISSTMYVTYAVVREAVFEATFKSVAVHFLGAALKICFVMVVKSYQQQVERSGQLGPANNGWQQQPDGRTTLTYDRLI